MRDYNLILKILAYDIPSVRLFIKNRNHVMNGIGISLCLSVLRKGMECVKNIQGFVQL